MGELRAHAAEPVRLTLGLRADDDPRQAGVEQRANRFFVANAAPQFARNVDRLDDGPNDVEIDELAVASPVAIDEGQMPGTLGREAPGDAGRVVVEHGLASVVALLEANAATAAQVDGRPKFHRVDERKDVKT